MPTKAAVSKPTKHSFGWVRDLPDHRDFQYAAARRVTTKLPVCGRSAAGLFAG